MHFKMAANSVAGLMDEVKLYDCLHNKFSKDIEEWIHKSQLLSEKFGMFAEDANNTFKNPRTSYDKFF